ncbi:NAD(P)/FAD-dependent oxidoreductase [Sulfurivermis fontis]|uniref:NAD(P)/FAD-dependent oxidoreductase n=1 Tax=Sulfurivermis fontis TaxID=1972068 RepID=UPI000FD96C48|nr:NAD(P)/FAD-dependent oxidoreductase [Sulfurivermis fontis]
MTHITRRSFLKVAGGTAAVGAIGVPHIALGASKKVVVVGGGVGGATVAKYLRRADASIEVTLIEPNKHYYTCFMSNEVLGGERTMDSIKFDYSGLAKHGVKVVHDTVTGIDAAARKVTTAGGQTFGYDRCVVAPGIDFKWDAIGGYDEKAAEIMPHAWKAGPQTTILQKQLQDMKDGGTVIIAAPDNPFRCPPGPYERASQIAHYLKKHKPKSKVLILDAKDKFAKQGLFMAGWKKHYGDMIEWVGAAGGGKIESVDVASRSLQGAVEKYKGDVVNVIPPQKAGKIAHTAGLVNDKGWCPVNQGTFESTIHANIHVLGDASIAGEMPKSGYSANSQAKVCAAAVAALLNGMEAPVPAYVNTCYSLITPEHGISVAAVYQLVDGAITGVKGAGGLTPADASEEMLKREVAYAHSWFKNITADTFG